MGRYYFNTKTTVEQAMLLSIFKLKEFGLLRGYVSATLTWTYIRLEKVNSIGIVVNVKGEPCVKVNYTVIDQDGNKIDYCYKISLSTTPCNFGGVRYWFICPLSKNGLYCGRRVGTLYIVPGAKYFGCRHCYNLSYETRNEPRFARFGGWGYPLKAEIQYEELYKKIKRWTYRGRPTRKVRKLHALEQKKRILASQALTVLERIRPRISKH